RGILARERLHAHETVGKDARPVKELLIERADRCQSLARKIAPPHANDVEALERRVLAVDEPEGDDIAAHAADAADHDLRPDAGELMHRRQAADIDVVADLAMAAERRRRRENHVVADRAVVTDMAVVHEEAALADAREAAALDGADVHGDAF